MQTTTITLHTDFQIGAVDPRIFGGFLEHMGRAVYEGVYDPESRRTPTPTASAPMCCRRSRRLRMTAMRYPGGNFASGYHWQDGIGPRETAPRPCASWPGRASSRTTSAPTSSSSSAA